MTSLLGLPPPLLNQAQSRMRVRQALKFAGPPYPGQSTGLYDVSVRQTLAEIQAHSGKQVQQRRMERIWQDAERDRQAREDIPANKDVRIFSADGRPVCVIVRGALNQTDTAGKPYSEQLSAALRSFNLDFPPSAKTANEKRHLGAQPDSQLQRDLLAGETAGVFHLGEWAEQGRSGNAHAVKVTSETLEGQRKGLRAAALVQLVRFFVPAYIILAIFSSYLAPQAATIKNKHTPATTFTGTAVLSHLSSLTHRDASNSRYFLTEMVVVGDLHGGELYLEDWGLVIPYRSGDTCLFYASSIPHAILPFLGRRYSLVNFTHTAAMNLIAPPDLAAQLKLAETFEEPVHNSQEYVQLTTSLKQRLKLAEQAKERQEAINVESAAGVHSLATHLNRHPGSANIPPPPLPPLASLTRNPADGHYSLRP
ncbi:hypothetical protein NBRC10512_002705 [Rhodotorula toruloides]